jgi:hypothetical protein
MVDLITTNHLMPIYLVEGTPTYSKTASTRDLPRKLLM